MKHDEIGYWSELKLDIIKEYASAYSRILSAQKSPSFYHVYIDGFAGSGIHKSKTQGKFVPGSPLNALSVKPKFKEYHLIDLDDQKIESLKDVSRENPAVRIYHGDCNNILVTEVFPNVQFKDYKRALCVLDPYGLHLSWEVMRLAGEMKSMEFFLNFPVMDMNMNVLWNNPEKVDSKQIDRMNYFWGDDSWRKAAYDTSQNLFGFEEKTSNIEVVRAFQVRLKKEAGFQYVPDPIPMRNNQGAIVYYLFFASQKPVAADIVTDIFTKYRDKGKK